VTDQSTPQPVLDVTDDGPIRRVTFNRPRVHNAQNPDMLNRLAEVLEETRRSPAIRVLVLAGAGKSFCSGHDLRAMADNPAYAENASTAEGRYWQELNLFVEPVRRFREIPIPTICRVQGYCLAAGLMFASAADFVVAADDAAFGSPVLATQAVNDAEVPGFAWRVGERRAKQALWLNERFDAKEAERIGLVNWVVPLNELDARVEEVANRLLEIPREALAVSKATFQFMADRQGERDVNSFHYMAHQFTHQTDEAKSLLRARVENLHASDSDRQPGAPE
jgi:enoyl-CoA hydratase